MKSETGQHAMAHASEAGDHPGNFGTPSISKVLQLIAARKAWDADHPEIAPAWAEALREDGERTDRKERAERLETARQCAPDVLRRIGAPLDAIDALRAPQATQALLAARKFTSDISARFLVLLGSKGVGKTAAAVHCLREAIAKERTAVRPSGSEARTFPAAQFIRAATFARLSAYGEADKLWYSELCGCSTLVLDDFGAEELGTIARSLLDEMLDTRHASRRRTVITSNLGKAEFKARMGERLMDRIASSAVVAVCVGDSLRKRTL